MCAASVQYQQHLAVCHPSIEVTQPLQEDDLLHPGLLVAAILTSEAQEIDMAEAARSGILANNSQGHYVGPVNVSADSHSNPVLCFASFPPAAALLMNCQPKT